MPLISSAPLRNATAAVLAGAKVAVSFLLMCLALALIGVASLI